MKKVIVLTMLLTSSLFAQSEDDDVITTGAPFQTIAPSPALNGMGNIGVALPNNDAFNFYYNPAQLGYSSRTSNINQSAYTSKTTWLPGFADASINNYALQFGYNFSDKLNLPLSVGLGFMRMSIGFPPSYYQLVENGPIYSSNSSESSNSINFGASLSYDRVILSAGFGVKRISSSYSSGVTSIAGNASAFDWGILAVVPIIKSFAITNQLNLFSNASFGFSQLNIGSEISYVDQNQKDPLPRVVRVGYAFNSGLSYNLRNNTLKLIEGDFSGETVGSLVKRTPRYLTTTTGERIVVGSDISYAYFLGETKFRENLILGRSGVNSPYYQGWRVNFAETVTLSGGKFNGIRTVFDTNSKASGYIIQSAGVFKIIQSAFRIENPLMKFVLRNVDLQYAYSKYEYTTRNQSNELSSYKGFNVAITSLNF